MSENKTFNEVVFVEGEKWETVPLFKNVYASNLGNIKRIYHNGDLKICKQYPIATSKGHYLGVSIPNLDGLLKTVPVHRLVALAFHGVPDNYGDPLLTVNHKDGDKCNNRCENLEWCSRTENLVHAYQAGLRTENSKVIVKDIQSGLVTEYYSIAEFARVFNLTKTKASNLIAKHSDKPYLGRYLLERDISARVVNRHSWVKDIVALNYKTKELIIGSDSYVLESKTGVNRSTILYALRTGKLYLVKGIVFKYKDDDTPFPNFTPEEVDHSIKRYNNKKQPAEKRYGLKVMDYTTGEVRTYTTHDELIAKEAIGKKVIYNLLNGAKDGLYQGKGVKRLDDTTPFKEYSKEAVAASLKYKKILNTVVSVTDMVTNTTEHYPTVRAFALSIGQDPTSICNRIRVYPDLPVKERYLVKITHVHKTNSSPTA